MATEIRIVIFDDLDGREGAKTVPFALDGTNYEIDLSEAHEKLLREGLMPFIAAGRRVAATPAAITTKARGSQRVNDRERSAQIRAWAKKHGLVQGDRGRLASNIVDAYEAGNPAIARQALPTPAAPVDLDQALANAGPPEVAELQAAVSIAKALTEPETPSDLAGVDSTPVDGPEWDNEAPTPIDGDQVRNAKIRRWARKTGASSSSVPSKATIAKYEEFFKARL